MLTANYPRILIACTVLCFCGFASAQQLADTQSTSNKAQAVATDALILKSAQASFAEYFNNW